MKLGIGRAQLVDGAQYGLIVIGIVDVQLSVGDKLVQKNIAEASVRRPVLQTLAKLFHYFPFMTKNSIIPSFLHHTQYILMMMMN